MVGFNLKLYVSCVPSERNKTDTLMRVKNKWLKMIDNKRSITETCCLGYAEVKELHDRQSHGGRPTFVFGREGTSRHH